MHRILMHMQITACTREELLILLLKQKDFSLSLCELLQYIIENNTFSIQTNHTRTVVVQFPAITHTETSVRTVYTEHVLLKMRDTGKWNEKKCKI